jgi:hypothetical protein
LLSRATIAAVVDGVARTREFSVIVPSSTGGAVGATVTGGAVG